MSLRTQLTDQLKDAMRARDAQALNALRYLLSLIKNVEIDTRKELIDEEIISLLQKEVKRRRDAIDQFRSASRQDLVDSEELQLTFLVKFLPKQLTKEEIEAEVRELVAQLSQKDMSIAMREIMPKFKGRADGKMVSELVKSML